MEGGGAGIWNAEDDWDFDLLGDVPNLNDLVRDETEQAIHDVLGDDAFTLSSPPPSRPPPYLNADHFRTANPPQLPIFGTRDFRQHSTTQPVPPSQPATQHPPRPIPSASHSEDWLDERAADPRNHATYELPANLFPVHSPHSQSHSPASWLDEDQANPLDFVTLESESESEAGTPRDTMPQAAGIRRASGNNLVDLTSDEVSAQSPGVKRAADSTTSQTRPAKRGKSSLEGIEEINLTNEAPSAEEELLQAQRQEIIKAQQAAEDDGPVRIGKRQCIICMENYTNCTVTACGHIYCHECLTQALKAGEKSSDRGIGNCPVCRKPLSRNFNKKRHDLIPISFMKKSTYDRDYAGWRYCKGGFLAGSRR